MIKKFSLLFLIFCSSAIFAMPSAVLFDVDGVLVDTEYLKYEAWRDALATRNIKFTIDEYMPLVGSHEKYIAAKIAKNTNKAFDQKQLIADKNANYKIRQQQGVPPIKPAVDFLNNLLTHKQQLKLKIAVVSTPSHEEIITNLKFAGVKYELLDGIFSGDDDLKHINDPEGTNKPKPYIYQLAAQTLKINPKQAVVFEDTKAGVSAAADAGMIVVAMPNRFTAKQDFSKARLVSSFNTFTLNDLSPY